MPWNTPDLSCLHSPYKWCLALELIINPVFSAMGCKSLNLTQCYEMIRVRVSFPVAMTKCPAKTARGRVGLGSQPRGTVGES